MIVGHGVEYVRDDAQRRIRVTVRGRPTRAMLQSVVDRQVRERTWTYGILWDVRGVAEPVAWPDAEHLARHVSIYMARLGPRGPVAVVSRQMRMIGATHLYAYRTAPPRLILRTFQDVCDAEQWLDQATRAVPPSAAGAPVHPDDSVAR